ncbi:hypothetical protein H1C71_032607, partial [Ictidomys tridecemlineatus]
MALVRFERTESVLRNMSSGRNCSPFGCTIVHRTQPATEGRCAQVPRAPAETLGQLRQAPSHATPRAKGSRALCPCGPRVASDTLTQPQQETDETGARLRGAAAGAAGRPVTCPAELSGACVSGGTGADPPYSRRLPSQHIPDVPREV